jgi:hypothetical protein
MMEFCYAAIYFVFLELLPVVKRHLPWKRAKALIGVVLIFPCVDSLLDIVAIRRLIM